LSRVGKKLEDLLSAAAFAESGEFETAMELLEGNKKVLLVLTGRESDTKSLDYALSIARRTDAGLEVLSTSTTSQTSKIMDLCKQETTRNSVSLRSVKARGCVRDALFAHMKKRRDIICVVIESTETLRTDCSHGGKSLDGIWEKLGCPLALVAEKTRPPATGH
jgi:hypothetical protein